MRDHDRISHLGGAIQVEGQLLNFTDVNSNLYNRYISQEFVSSISNISQKKMIHNILLKFLLHISSPKPKKKMAFLSFHLKVKGIAFLDTAILEVGGVLHSLLRCQEWQVRPSSAIKGGFLEILKLIGAM